MQSHDRVKVPLHEALRKWASGAKIGGTVAGGDGAGLDGWLVSHIYVMVQVWVR